jgi:hypothetical protein
MDERRYIGGTKDVRSLRSLGRGTQNLVGRRTFAPFGSLDVGRKSVFVLRPTSYVPRPTERGQMATEFVLTLPVAMALIVAVVAIAVFGVRGIAGQLAAQRAARAASLFQEDLAQVELDASLSTALFRDGAFEIAGVSNAARPSNAEEGTMRIGALSNAALGHAARGFGAVFRTAPIVPALPAGLGNSVLREGDTPSPYCRNEGGYAVCGFPR